MLCSGAQAVSRSRAATTARLFALGDTTRDTDAAALVIYANLTIDAGFVPFVSVGDYVWFDANGDGLQDDTDVPLAGVTLTITNVDGAAVTDVYGNPVTTTTTDADGRYSFDFLPFGQYVVTVTVPAGYLPTIAGAGDDDGVDSSDGSATSIDLTFDGQRDPTLDFGFVIDPSAVGSSEESAGEEGDIPVGGAGDAGDAGDAEERGDRSPAPIPTGIPAGEGRTGDQNALLLLLVLIAGFLRTLERRTSPGRLRRPTGPSTLAC